MTEPASRPLTAGLALAARREGCIDVGHRDDADAPLEPGGELPFGDRTVATLYLGDAATSLSVRDQVQLLIECRRVLAPRGTLLLAEGSGADSFVQLARWAALVGLLTLPPESAHPGWTKRDGESGADPLVSIAIPSSNPRYFLECLDSAIAQTYPNVEIVICDDSEGEAIPAMVSSRDGLAAIRYEKNPERLRARLNYGKCLSLAHGEYVKFLNDDDVLEPDCVARLLGAFLQVPDLVLATSHRLRIDALSRPQDDMPATRPIVDRDVIIDGVSLANAAIMHGLNFIGEPSTAMFRRTSLDCPGPGRGGRPFQFDGEEVRGAIDFAMWSRLLVQGNAAFFRDRLSRFRIHGEQAQARPEVVARSIAGVRGLQRKWVELGLFRQLPPHLLRAQPFPRDEADADDWWLTPVLSLPPSPLPPDEAVRAWRSVRRHPFDSG